MKPTQGGERRAQLVAGIGDEIDADAVGTPLFRQVVEDERDEMATAVRAVEAGEPGGKPALGRDALGELDPLRRPAFDDPVECRDQVRGA